MSKEGVESGTTKLALASGETITMIAFGVPIPADEVKEDGPKWTAKILRLKQQDVEQRLPVDGGLGVEQAGVDGEGDDRGQGEDRKQEP